MKNLSPVWVLRNVQQFYAAYAWWINYASDASFSFCGFISIFLTHNCKFKFLTRPQHHLDVCSRSYFLLVYSGLWFDLFRHLPAVCLFQSCLLSFCLFVMLTLTLTLPSRRRTSTLCIAWRTSTSFHLTVQVDPQRHFSFIYLFIYPRMEVFFPMPPQLHPLQTSSYSLTCVRLPASCHPTRTSTLPPSPFVFPIWPVPAGLLLSAGSVILISSEWATAHGCRTDDCTLSLSRVTQNAPWITQTQRGTQASRVTWRMETPGRRRRSWSSVKAWDALRDKWVVTLPPEVKTRKRRSRSHPSFCSPKLVIIKSW